MDEVGSTRLSRAFAGEMRTFELRLGEIRDLETTTGATIGIIVARLGSAMFSVNDVREPIRLGLIGGGMSEPAATALVMRHVDGKPLMTYLRLASEIVEACMTGVPDEAGKAGEEDQSAAPATSAPSTEPVLS